MQDALEDNNPILRALAIRTMGCIRVSQITEYLVDPLREALKDEDSYVRKTGVICIAKLYECNPEMIERLGFIKMLENLLTDGNAMVVSNAIAVLGQISDQKGENLVHINDHLANKLINALSEANEWGKTYILDAFAKYEPSNPKIAEE
jgi:vesicle coat complex subunit